MNTLPAGPAVMNEPGASAALPPRGRATRLSANVFGTAISAADRGASWPHPFKPAPTASGIAFSRGLVDVYEPLIRTSAEGADFGGVVISSGAILRLSASVATAQGESWCCVEVTPNEQGQLDGQSRVEMVHTRQPYSNLPEIGRTPVCLVLWQRGKPVSVHPIVYFNLRYQRASKADELPARHFFW